MRATPPIMHPHRLCSLRTQIYCINEYFHFDEAAHFSNNLLNEYYDLSHHNYIMDGKCVVQEGGENLNQIITGIWFESYSSFSGLQSQGDANHRWDRYDSHSSLLYYLLYMF